MLFSSPLLTSINTIIPPENNGYSVSDLLNDIVAIAPSLTSLSLVASQRAGNRATNHEDAIGTLPQRLERLAILKLPPYFLTSTVLELLSESQIVAIEFSELPGSVDNAGDPRDVSFLRPDFQHGAFPALRRLSICGRLPDLSVLLSDIFFPAENLVDIVVRSVRSESETDTRLFVKDMVKRCFRLTSVFLLMTRPLEPLAEWCDEDELEGVVWLEDWANEPLTMETIRPLTTLRDMQRVSIAHARPLNICNDDVHFLCSRLSGLRRLILNPVPRFKATCDLTLLSMAHVSSLCPRIRHLALYAYPPTLQEQNYLKTVTHFPTGMQLQLHASPLQVDEQKEVALFLSRILRPGANFRYIIAPMADADARGYAVKTTSPWAWVIDRVSLMLEAREEERSFVCPHS
ncbi:unnamed protein product [Peniophora sp. CBMAI 1063]|nr:unnamed protein product [Peniophora sp. CBMAI 1063]